MAPDLRLRLTLTHLGVLLVGFLFLGLAFTVILSNRVSAAHQSDLRYETSSLAAQLDRALSRNVSKTSIQRLIRRDSELLGKRIFLFDSRGRVRYDSSRWTPFSRGSWRLVDLAALRRGTSTRTGSSNRFGWQVPLRPHGHIAGAVALVITASDVTPPWRQILPSLLAFVGLLFLAWLLIGAHFVRSLTRPLRRVSAGLVLVRGGQYDRPVPEEGWSETRELARRYNEMVAEVARSQQLLRDFMVNAAHELKTPVSLVAGFARSLGDGTAVRGGAVPDAVEYIQAESEHLARVVDQLFALASLDADGDGLILSPCRPADLLGRVMERFSPRALEDGKALTYQCDDDPPDCVWDTERVMSALTNLVSNALDYTQTGDAIVARAKVCGNQVAFDVADTGCGIATNDMPRIFDRFYRGGGSTRSHGHAGLGLAMVQQVAQRHGGSVTVESRVGEGTHFTLALPFGRENTEHSGPGQTIPPVGLTA